MHSFASRFHPKMPPGSFMRSTEEENRVLAQAIFEEELEKAIAKLMG